MAFTAEQRAALSGPLDKAHVAQRSQGGGKVSYIEGWHAIAEANRIFGFDAWTRETVELRLLGEPREVDGKVRVEYLARVRITVTTTDGVFPIVREGCGFGQGIDRDVGQAHESALKEAETDAMKRALMTFGNPFGLALYDKSQANVQAAPAPMLSDEQRDNIATLASAAGVSLSRICEAAQAKDLREVPASAFDGIVRRLNATIGQKKAA